MKKMSQINCRVSTLETSGKKYIESHNFRVSLDEKMESNLKENLRNFYKTVNLLLMG